MTDPDLTIEPTTLAPYRIGPDWLALSMSGPTRLLDFVEPQPWQGGRWWVDSGHNTRVMSKVFYLMDGSNRKLLTVAGAPFSRAVGPPDWMLVQFANHTLYSGAFVELYQELRSMGFQYKGTTRLDLAADALAGNGGDFMEPIERTWKGEASYYGKAQWTPTMKGRNAVQYAYLGSKAGNKFLRCYNKTKEIKTPGAMDKAPYIRAAWEAALGWDPVEAEQTVNRLEIQVKGRELRRYFPEESPHNPSDADKWIEKLTDRARVTDIYASLVTGLYDFRTPAIRARDAQPLVVWDFGAVTENIEVREREPRHLAITGQALKGMIKVEWQLATITNDHHTKARMMEVAHAAGLNAWLEKSIPIWERALQRILDKGETTMVDRLDKLRL